MIEKKLTAEDLKNLESYKAKCSEVKDFTTAVLRGTHTGMMLFGSGGNGKSFSIRETFDAKGIKEIQPEETMSDDAEDAHDGEMFEADDGEHPLMNGTNLFVYPAVEKKNSYNTFVLHQGRITPKGLVLQMAKFPESVHLVEDAETMFDDKNCWGLLRMALHSQDHDLHSKRRITWKTSVKEGSFDFFFTGSLIIVGNRLLNTKSEEVQAVQTRCPCMTFDISNAELIAKMKEICEKGYKAILGAHLNKDDCYNVLSFILSEIENDVTLKRDGKGKDKKLNLRILLSGFRFMALSKLEPSISWRNMVLSQLKQVVGAGVRSRAERVHDEKKIAQQFGLKKFASEKEKLIAWCKEVDRNLEWSEAPVDSDVYRRGYDAAKMDLKRKKK